MAPIRSLKAKSAKSLKPRPTLKDQGSFDSELPSSKKDKRQIKHSAFVTKIEKPNKKALKRRRPSKKLVANLNSLADALPDTEDAGTVATEAAAADVASNSQVNIIKHKSLKHRPGAMKRKEKLDKMERERFAKNMNQLAGGLGSDTTTTATPSTTSMDINNDGSSGTGDGNSSTSARWAALRGFISQTMDQNPGFKNVRS